MKPPYITDDFLKRFIDSALFEDVGDGDHSSLATIPERAQNKAKLLIKDDGIIAGVELAKHIFNSVDKKIKIDIYKEDGQPIKFGDIAFTVAGSARTILLVERLVLNCMQRMSAISTRTQKFVKLIAGTKAQLLDTRKTTPNFRLLEKWAVLTGGGKNHRMGLFDMIMLKDNHIDMAGGILPAINRTKEYLRANNKKLQIEIETRNLSEVQEVLSAGGIDIIMLDNMDVKTMIEAVRLINGKYKTEASGGVTEETIRGIAECGVDYISVGALTHAVKSLDLSLKATAE
ncbi:MAG: carboxylating nicotinate-nucleotide diphosphorylase [Cyclobacteriaceae bacterium]